MLDRRHVGPREAKQGHERPRGPARCNVIVKDFVQFPYQPTVITEDFPQFPYQPKVITEDSTSFPYQPTLKPNKQ